MKVSQSFKTVIEQQIKLISQTNQQLAEALDKDGKNIDDCLKYIIMTVKKSGLNGFADQEIFDMATNYYLSDNIDLTGDLNCHVVVNRVVQLTEEEKLKAKDDALKALVQKETQRLSKPKATAKPDKKSNVSLSLFD